MTNLEKKYLRFQRLRIRLIFSYTSSSQRTLPDIRPREDEVPLPSKPRRAAMRLALYIKTMGAEPLPFEHTDFVSYQNDLEKQAEELKLHFGSKKDKEARRAVRGLIKATSLSIAAAGLVPLHSLTPVRTVPNNRLRRQCRRKLVHTNFLSALRHAHQLAQRSGDSNLRIYPCLVCNGIHIGHSK